MYKLYMASYRDTDEAYAEHGVVWQAYYYIIPFQTVCIKQYARLIYIKKQPKN